MNKLSSNLNIVECKVDFLYSSSILLSGSNLNIVECKAGILFSNSIGLS